MTTKEKYQKNNKVAITAGNEAMPTTIKTIEVEKTVRFLRA